MKLKFLTALFLATTISTNAQQTIVQPEFWYSGFNDNNLQLLIHGENIGRYKATINTTAATLCSEQRVKNQNYLFLNLQINGTGSFEILLQDSIKKKNKQSIKYEIKPRTKRTYGFSDKDLLYMIMPDRFANGDPSNDNMPGYLEKANNSNPDGRHGGDIKGIANNIEYLKNLGVTALWINPLLENNMPAYSYHGYAITNFYNVDARFGTNQDYKNLADSLHQNGIKLIMDMVFNHCGSNNFIYKDLPDSTWFHFWNKYTTSNYRATVCIDPHASQNDQNFMLNGWFDRTMPDINQNNQMALTYLIQNSIWWAEYLGLDGIRMDTYPYNDKYAMKKWCDRMHSEFPGFSLLGECWLNDNPFTTYFAKDVKNIDRYTSGLDHVTDFPLTFALNKGFQEQDGWDTGITRVYQSFVSDYLQPYPEKNVIFIDNHDLNRIYTDIHNIDKLKMIYTIILTTRGIPCLYYGSELLYESEKSGDGYKRKNMYGGFNGDTKNAFTTQGLTAQEKDMQSFITKLAKYRKTTPAFSGKMIHFVPQDGVYVYFRIKDNSKVMITINNSDKQQTIDLSRFAECLNNTKSIEDILTDIIYLSVPQTLTLKPKSSGVWQLNQYEIEMEIEKSKN